MEVFNIVIARIDTIPGRLVVVPCTERLEFSRRSIFTDSEFLDFLTELGVHSNEARSVLERSCPAPKSFELCLALSDKQIEYALSYFPPAA